MGFTAPVDSGVTPPTFLTITEPGTCMKKTTRDEAVMVEAFGPIGLHGQTKVKRIKHTMTANGKGVVAAAAGTGVGTSEANAIIDKLNDGQQGEDFDNWSVEAHWFTAPA